MKQFTVILPAAGKGSRLNLPYSKEILRVDKDQALIDFTFDHFNKEDHEYVKFVVVINDEKTDIVKYLSKYKDKFDISFVFQKEDYPEYIGAIKSAREYFSDYNLVLLPDAVMTLYPEYHLLTAAYKALANSESMFFYKIEGNPAMLKTKGALRVENGFLKAYQDKPEKDFDKYNAYWTAFGFHKHASHAVLDFMEGSMYHEKASYDLEDSILDSACVPVRDYRDLGTWDQIKLLLGNDLKYPVSYRESYRDSI